MKRPSRPWAALLALAALAACRGTLGGEGELHQRRALLRREVAGLREAVSRLERGESLVSANEVAIGIDERLLQDLIAAQLPFQAEIDRFEVTLAEAEVHFRGSPLVRLRGSGRLKERPEISAVVSAAGVLEPIQIDTQSGTLRASISLDQLEIEKVAGLESLLGGATLDELARRLRLRIAGRLPHVEIPVRLQQAVVLPALSDGPVRIAGATMPLEISVSGAQAGQGLLWIRVSLRPGDVAKTPAAVSSPEPTR